MPGKVGRPGMRPARPPWRQPVAWLIVAVLTVAALATGGVLLQPRHWNACHGLSWRYLQVWHTDHGCVGVTDGGTPIDPAFDAELGGRFGALLADIHAENLQVEAGRVDAGKDGLTSCTSTADDAVDVAALAPWRFDIAGGRAFHELEGMYVAQWQANHRRQPGGCEPFIRLLIADPGADMGGWREVVQELLADPKLVAVTGLAISRAEMIESAHELNRHGIPIVADLVTADGFDRTNFAGIPAKCAADYRSTGVLDQFYRMTFTNHLYLDQVGGYLRSMGLLGAHHAVQVAQEHYEKDAFACTNVEHVTQLLDPAPDPITFELSAGDNDPTGQLQTKVTPICTDPAIRTVFYTARALDLANFIIELDKACPNGITVGGPTDTTRLLTRERTSTLEVQRQAALKVLRTGNVKVYFAATNTPARLAAGSGFADFKTAFTGAFSGTPHAELFPFTDAELADTWMVNAHDAFFVIAAAVHALHTNGQAHTPQHVAGNLSTFQLSGAAQGTLKFDQNGTHQGVPVVLRLCSSAAGPSVQPVTTGKPAACPQDSR